MFSTLVEIANIINIFITVVSYLLRGFSYNALLGTYLGFVPIVGDLTCKYKIAQEYENPYRIQYLVTAIIFAFLPFFIFIMKYFTQSKFIRLYPVYFLISSVVIFIIAGILIVNMFVQLYFNYKVIYPLVYDLSDGNAIGLKTFLFVILPFSFYIFIIVKNYQENRE